MENAVLIGVVFPGDSPEEAEESLFELRDLAKTAGANVRDTFVQHRRDIDPKTFIGKGKVEEIRTFLPEDGRLDLVILNHEASPTQVRNLQEALGVRVVTRTELILDIFAIHARTKISRLQVELAQLEYQLPRIAGKGASMSRLGGGIGTRGPGEQQLEYDRRAIRKRIHLIREKLEEAARDMETRRHHRVENERKVGIVGYTNAGKSSLLNRLTRSDVLVEDRLFATLDTTTRRLWLSPDLTVTVTDTVGFIRDIPHSLIESFRSTLMDTTLSDLLLHVVDASARDLDDRIAVVRDTLAAVSDREIPEILCFNKIDRLSPEAVVELRMRHPTALFMSVKENRNVDALRQTIHDRFPAR